jgi:fused signal recognition particle receptor
VRFWRKKTGEETEQAQGVAVAEPDAAEAEAEAAAELEEVREQTERAVERTRRGFFGRIGGLFERSDFDDDLWDELEEILIGADAGLATTSEILDTVRGQVKKEGVKQSARVRELLREELIAVLEQPGDEPAAWERGDVASPLIILVVGVNGAGKTTTIAKMAHAFKRDGASVVLGAADTFRAAATDQLKVWGERVGVRVVAH